MIFFQFFFYQRSDVFLLLGIFEYTEPQNKWTKKGTGVSVCQQRDIQGQESRTGGFVLLVANLPVGLGWEMCSFFCVCMKIGDLSRNLNREKDKETERRCRMIHKTKAT